MMNELHIRSIDLATRPECQWWIHPCHKPACWVVEKTDSPYIVTYYPCDKHLSAMIASWLGM